MRLLNGVLSHIARTADKHTLALQIDAACLQHILKEVDIAIASSLRTDERTAELLTLASEHAYECVRELLYCPNI